MSAFDFPRISFAGTVALNPCTANTNVFAGLLTAASEEFPNLDAGRSLALFDSVNVRPCRHGLSDEDWMHYVQQPQPAGPPGASATGKFIPAGWNYYGDMSFDATPKVVGVQLDAMSAPLTSTDPSQPLSGFLGQPVNLHGTFCAVNADASLLATQVFLNGIELLLPDTKGQGIAGQPNKATCQWLYSTRNVTLAGDAGVGGYFHHAIHTTRWTLPGTAPAGFAGYVLRYYIFAQHNQTTDPARIADFYRASARNIFAPTNHAEFQIAGSITPFLSIETILSGPLGRLLIQNTPNIPTPSETNNAGGGPIAMAPAVVHADAERVSVDFLGTFPETCDASPTVTWATPDLKNPKFDVGDAALHYTDGSGEYSVAVDYADIPGGNARGWVFDYPLSAFKTSVGQSLTRVNTDGVFHVTATKAQGSTTLAETDYQVVSNAQALYAEQDYPGHPGSSATSTGFVNQGYPPGEASFELFYRGTPVLAASAPKVTLWAYQTTPLIPGQPNPRQERRQIATHIKPGDPIKIDTAAPGNWLLTFEIEGQGTDSATGEPPETYDAYATTTHCNRPAINIRILPNEDYSQFYEDATATPPVANDSLTWDVVYENVLRTYYLLFPTMQQFFDLSSEDQVRASIPDIRATIRPDAWMNTGYMPVTRDLSQSRRDLLLSWFNRVDPPEQD